MVCRLGSGAQGAFRRLCRDQAEAERSRLWRPSPLLGADDVWRGYSRRYRRPLRSRARRRIPGHQPPAVLGFACLEARRPWPHRGRRRCAIHLFVPSGDRSQHPGLSRSVQSQSRNRHAWPKLSFNAADPFRCEWRNRSRAWAFHQESNGPNALQRSNLLWSLCATRRTRRGTSLSRSSKTVRKAAARRR